MDVVVRWMRGWIRPVLAGVPLAALILFVASGPTPVAATGTNIIVSSSSTSPVTLTNVNLVADGDPATVYVWVTNVNDLYGVGAYDVGFSYDASLITVTQFNPDTTWLGITGRAPSCLAPWWDNIPPYLQAIPGDPDGLWEGFVSCGTLLPPPPFGPKCPSYCNGLLATITLQPGATPGNTTLDFTHGSLVVNTGHVSGGTPKAPEEIPTKQPLLSVTIVRCADFDADGSVTIDDVAAVASRFLMSEGEVGWDPLYDINDDGAITIDDIAGTATQFLQLC